MAIPFDNRPIHPSAPRAEDELPLRPGEYDVGDAETHSEFAFLRAWSGQVSLHRRDFWYPGFRKYHAKYPTVAVQVADESCWNSAQIELTYAQLRALAAEFTRLADDMAAEQPEPDPPTPDRMWGIERYYRDHFAHHFAVDRREK